MSGQNEAETLDTVQDSTKGANESPPGKEAEPSPSRQRSTIAFPYNDLADATQFAQAIHDHAGHGDCDDDQLAAWVDQSPKSSGFRTQLSAARLFGVIESDGAGRHKLTTLGQQIVDPGQAHEARIHAFLNVPLFKIAYDNYKSTVVPPTSALERDFVRFGVAEKQKDRARIAFNKSAEQAGFFAHGKSKLVQPGTVSKGMPPNIAADVKEDTTGNGGGGDGPSLDLDPLLMALLQKIPSKDEGWNASRRVRWFRTFAMNVSQVYDDDEEPIELKIEISENGGQ
jgi:hypothetical protein